MRSVTSVLGPCVRGFTDPHRGYFWPAVFTPVVEPSADLFSGRPIVPKDLIEVLVIKVAANELLECRKFVVVTNKPDPIERGRLEDDLNLVIVAMQPAAGVLGGQVTDHVRSRKLEAFCYSEHGHTVRSAC